MKCKRVLITGAGGPGAVNMTRSLRDAPEEVFTVGADASRFYVHLAETDEKVLVPKASEPDYIDSINGVSGKFSIDFIMPNSSVEMEILGKNRDALGAKTFFPGSETLEIANSKWLSYLKWRDAGTGVPATILIEKEGDVERAFGEIGTNPVWFRGAGIPGKGIGGAALPCRTPLQAKGWIEFYRGYGGFIASEYLPGRNLTWIGLFRNGALITSQGRERDAYVIPHVSPSGITGAPAISHTIHSDELNNLGLKAALAIDREMNGVCFIDFKESADGRLLPTEINAGRFGTTHYFYARAGLNLPYLLLKTAFGEPLPADLKKFNPLPPDIYWIRTLDCGPVMKTKEEIEDLSGRMRLR